MSKKLPPTLKCPQNYPPPNFLGIRKPLSFNTPPTSRKVPKLGGGFVEITELYKEMENIWRDIVQKENSPSYLPLPLQEEEDIYEGFSRLHPSI